MLLSFLLLLCSRFLLRIDAQQCFFPDGTVSTDIACESNSTFSACCGEGGVCYSNGVCEYSDILSNGSIFMDYQRSSCTDKTWKTNVCFDGCPEPWHGGSEAVRPCGGISAGLTYCCADGLEQNSTDDYSCCQTQSNIFTIAALPTQIAIIANGTSVPIARSSSATVTTPAPSHSQPATGGGSDGFNTKDKIGLGCGISFALLAILTIAILYVNRRRKRVKRQTSFGGEHTPASFNHGNGLFLRR